MPAWLKFDLTLMIVSNSMFRDIAELYRNYSNYNWFLKLFFPRELKHALNYYNHALSQNNDEEIIEACTAVCDAFFNVHPFFKWLYNAISIFSNTKAARIVSIVGAVPSLSEEQRRINFKLSLQQNDHYHLENILTTLYESNALETESTCMVLQHKNLLSLSRSLTMLHEDNLLSTSFKQRHYGTIIFHRSPIDLEFILLILSQNTYILYEARENILYNIFYYQNPEILSKIIGLLQEDNLLKNSDSQPIFRVLRHREPLALYQVLLMLHKANQLTQVYERINLLSIINSEYTEDFANLIQILEKNNLLINEQVQYDLNHVIMRRMEIKNLLTVLSMFDEKNLLAGEYGQEYFNLLRNTPNFNMGSLIAFLSLPCLYEPEILITILRHLYSPTLISILTQLQNANILTAENWQVNFVTISEYRDLRALSYGLSTLERNNLLTDENYMALIQNEEPSILVDAIVELNNNHLLDNEVGQENRIALLQHNNLHTLSRTIGMISEASLLTGEYRQQNLKAILDHPNLTPLSFALGVFHHLQLFSGADKQRNFNNLINNSEILLNGVVAPLWEQILRLTFEWGGFFVLGPPPVLFNQEHYEFIINICLNDTITVNDKRRQINAYIRREILQEQVNVELINDRQSTHTASVHKSVSESAIRLKERYTRKINNGTNEVTHHSTPINRGRLNTVIAQLIHFINSFPDNAKYSVAKRCINRIAVVNFIDMSSNVSLRELLALTFIAVHDEENLTSSLNDAQNGLIEALYEIQRGDNLNAEGIDNNMREDDFICYPGTFNKLIEKLAVIHPDCEIIMITKEMASLKLPCVVREQSLLYLEQNLRTDTREAFIASEQLLTQVMTEGVEIIWENIKEMVAEKMFEEFGSLYYNRQNQEFITFINTGIYADIGDLSNLQEKMQDSLRNTRYQGYILRQQNNFFTNQQEDNSTQIDQGALSRAEDISSMLQDAYKSCGDFRTII